MEVRAASVEDAPAIAQVHVRSWHDAYVGLVPQWYLDGLSVEERRRAWDEMLERATPGSGVLVLVEAGSVVGFLGFGPSRDADAARGTGEVTSIYLLSGAWGRGGGRLLIREGLEGLRGAGHGSATLWVLDGNARARRFYETGGWATDGAEKVDDRRGFPLTEVRYTRTL